MGTTVTAFFRKFLGQTGSLVSGGLVVVQVLVSPIASAASAAISQGYKTNSNNISRGALLSLVTTGSESVEPTRNDSNSANMVGIAADKPLLELSNGTSGGSSVPVVVSGSTEALVSNINGDIKAGDKITASPVSGIGMKANNAAQIVGTAQSNFDAISTVEQQVTDKDGKPQTIKVGLLPLAVNVTYYSAASSQGTISSFIPPFLQSLANNIAGKQVSPLRVLIGTLVLLLGFVAVIVILQTSIRNGLISLGRNPLAQKALRRGLIDVILAAVGLLVVTTVLVYVTLIV